MTIDFSLLNRVRRTGLLALSALMIAPLSCCAAAPKVEKLAVFKQEKEWKGPASCAVHGDMVYVLYTADNNMGRVCRYDLSTGESASSGDQFSTIGEDDRSHNDAAIAVDGEGYIHAFIGMHNHRMKYFRSAAPGSTTDFEDCSHEIPGYFDAGVNEKRYTYPWICTAANGDVFMVLRRTGMFWDDSRKEVRESQHSEKQDLYQWDLKSKKWSVTPVKSQEGYNAYMSHMLADADNNIHIVTAWSWYHDGGNTFQRGSYLKFDGNARTYHLANGDEILLPLAADFPGANLFYEGDHPWGKETVEIQTPRVALDREGAPVVAYTHSPDNGESWNCRLAIWDDTEWRHTESILKGFYQYERPEITTTGGRYNIYVTGKVVSSKDSAFRSPETVTWENGTTVETVHPYDAKTDIVMDRQAIYKVSFP